MKKLLIIILTLITIGLSAQSVYYVQPVSENANASDSNAGTNIDYPWATWKKAFATADEGDTVYFRGGVWYLTSDSDVPMINPNSSIGNNGTAENRIHFLNYPGETPILDGSLLPAPPYNPPLDFEEDEDWVVGVDISWANFLHFRGLTVRNFYQHRNYVHVTGIQFGGCTNLILENMVSHHISGRGFSIQNNTFSLTPTGLDATVGYDTTRIINCDVYDCADSLRENDSGGGYGDWADGFAATNQHNSTTHERAYMEFSGCRAIRCSDDAWNAGGTGFLYIHNCWAVHAGQLNGVINSQGIVCDGDGGGFKVMPIEEYDMDDSYVQRVQINNIAAFNYLFGFGENNNYGPSVNQHVYNNTAYKNDRGFSVHIIAEEFEPHLTNDYRNNLAYGNYYADMNYGQGGYAVIDTCNSWNAETGVTVTDADFVVIDSALVYAQLTAARQADFSLPVITALRLAASSDLIDVGMDVGLPYNGEAPDLGYSEYTPDSRIIADHTIVDRFDDIPQYYLDEVKKMWLVIAGESHSYAYITGLDLLEDVDADYTVNIMLESGTPESYTSSYLRASRATWGDLTHSSGWIYSYGEEDWITSTTAINRTKDGIKYCYDNNIPIAAIGFGWCWDDDVGLDVNDYFTATQEYVDYCNENDYPTTVFYTTGPIDYDTPMYLYDLHVRNEAIRDYIDNYWGDVVFFDYADIICHDDDGTLYTVMYGDIPVPKVTPTNAGDHTIGHIGEAGAIRLAKATWWMLARIAGWDGITTEAPEVDSTATDIITFTLPTQTGAATINTTNHTVAIEVSYLATVTNLTPYISLSYGATISPTSMTSRDFTTPQTYTVTALDGTTTQEWVVTVTQAAEPEEPPASSSKIVKIGGYIIKL